MGLFKETLHLKKRGQGKEMDVNKIRALLKGKKKS